jgi:ABC-type phosphate transport system permease subunit
MDPQTELSHLRSLMNRSTKFISLSGLSGIMAGIYAISGGVTAWWLIRRQSPDVVDIGQASFQDPGTLTLQLLLIAVIVLALSIITGVWLTMRKATKRGETVWNAASKGLLGRLAVPLVSGGLLMLIFLYQGDLHSIAPASLVFYGLALVAGSYYTVSLVKYLGFLEIILGLVAALFPGFGLYFWIMGFGVLHIVYGSIMHFKYER